MPILRVKYEIFVNEQNLDEISPSVALEYIKQHIASVNCPEDFVQFMVDPVENQAVKA